jgi:ATP-dependent protease ClpP protease subunit
MNSRYRRRTALWVLPVSLVLIVLADAFGVTYGEPVVAYPPREPTAAASAAAAGSVRGRVDCQTAHYCLFKDLELVGTIDEAMTQTLTELFAEFSRRIDPKIQPNEFPHTEIKLNSVGGSVTAAMEIGRLLRKYRMLAVVSPSSVCVSACVLVYAGAVVRYGHFNAGRVGIHQPYLDFPVQQKGGPETAESESMHRDMRAYLREMNVSERLVDGLLNVPPTAVRYLTDDEQDKFGLVVFDPVDSEISEMKRAKELGISRSELMGRQARGMKECYVRDMASRSGACYREVVTTGKVPELMDFHSQNAHAK